MTADRGSPDPPDDDRDLEAELRRAATEFDPVRASLLQYAVDAFTFRDADAELAQLVFDSFAESSPVRGEHQPRLLTFRSGELTVELELTEGGAHTRLVGQLLPPGPAEVELRSRGGTIAIAADAWGRFAATLSPGAFSLRCRPSGGAPGGWFVTEWTAA